MDNFIEIAAHLIRHNCSDEVCSIIRFARDFQRENSDLKREVVDQAIEIARLKAENEFLLRTLEESENTD